jgi:crotonobetainyl-CoA:carnitine CoA-transferase CaiB-like acyl-CoA transferase
MQTPFSLSANPTEIHRRAPTLGEHTQQLMLELGYSESEIQRLRSARII